MAFDEDSLDFTPEVTFKPRNRGFGPVAPLVSRGKEEDPGLLESVSAYTMDTLPARLGAAMSGATYTDSFLDALNPSHDPYEIEPGFNPFEEWKTAGGDPGNLDDYMDMTSRKELAWYQSKREDQDARHKIVASHGLTGASANFVLNVATDPTMYFGFGTAQMLSKGMAASRAYAIGGAGGAAAYEGLNALADPEDANALKSGGVVAASAIMSGLLGKAVDSFKFVRAKNGKSDNFQDFSLDTLAKQQAFDADGGVAKSIGAMAAQRKDFDYRLGGNAAARVLGKLMSPMVPKLRGQTSEYKEIAEFYAEVIGTAALSKGNIEGEAGIISMAEHLETLKGAAMNSTRETITEIKKAKAAGKVFTDTDYKTGLVLANTRSNLDDPELLQEFSESAILIAKQHKKHFKEWQDILTNEGISGFQVRQNYAPAMIDVDRVSMNRDGFTSLAERSLKYARNKAMDDVKLLKSQIAGLTKRAAAEASDLTKKALQRQIDEFADELESLERLTRMSDEEVTSEAISWTNQFVTNSARDISGVVRGDLLPNRFKARLMDVRDYADFLHTDPVKLQTSYANSVAPKVAIQRVLKGESVDSYLKKFDDKIGALAEKTTDPKKLEKLKNEAAQARSDIKTAFDDMTGDYYKRAYEQYGQLGPMLSMASDATNISMLGGQVLAGVSEPANIMMHHGVMRGGAPMLRAISKLITDKEFRAASRAAAGEFGIGLEVTKSLYAGKMFDNTMASADVNGGIQSKIHRASGLFQLANGAAFWDSTMRTAAFVAQQGILVDGMERMLKGKIGKIEAADLAYLGLDKDMAKRVMEQVKKHPVQHPQFKKLTITNPDTWDDPGAAKAWVQALRRDNQRTMIQPQMGDTPFFWKTPLGANMFKFKNWAAGASTKILLQGVQKANGRTAAGAMSMVGLGATVDVLLNYSKGGSAALEQYQTENGGVSMPELAWAGVNRSGIMGIFPDFGGSAFVNHMFDIQSGGARYHEYKNFEESFAFGPAIAMAKDIRQSLPLPEKGPDGLRLPYTDQDGSLRQSSVNSMIDLLPLPFVKPYIKSGLDQTVFEGQ